MSPPECCVPQFTYVSDSAVFVEWFREEEAWKIKVAPGCPGSPTTNMPQTKIFCKTCMHPEWVLCISCFKVLLLKWAQSGCCKIRLHFVCIFSRLCVNRCCTVGGIFFSLSKQKYDALFSELCLSGGTLLTCRLKRAKPRAGNPG